MGASRWEWPFELALASVGAVSGYFLMFASNREVVMFSGVVLATALFFWRLKFRLTYGAMEVVFGLLVLWDATGRARVALETAFDSGDSAFRPYVVLMETLGAIYVLIRGLENCRLGLSANGSKAEATKSRP